jgi:hypothetical protein
MFFVVGKDGIDQATWKLKAGARAQNGPHGGWGRGRGWGDAGEGEREGSSGENSPLQLGLGHEQTRG